MSWTPLRSRTLDPHGLDWSAQLALSRVDPYLVWADATAFAGFVGGPPKNIQIAFEVDLGFCATAPGAKAVEEFVLCHGKAVQISNRFGVANVPRACLLTLLKPLMQALIPRFEIGLPLAGDPDLYIQGLEGKAAIDIFGASGVPVAAVIDDGCAFALDSLRYFDSGSWKTRLGMLWFQDDRSGSTWGFDAKTLEKWLNDRSRADGTVDELACYRDLRDELRKRKQPVAESWWRRINAPATHGAHVLDVMAGAPNPLAVQHRWGEPDDHAAHAPLMFVQLPRATVDDTSGLSMNVCVLEALHFIARRTGSATPVHVNLSYGSLAGPHDGTSLLEGAIDDFLGMHKRFTLTLPAGNGYDSRTHAAVVLAPDTLWHDLPLQLLPDDPTDTFVEVWYDTRFSGSAPTLIDVMLVAPDGTASPAAACDRAFEFVAAGATLPSAAIVHQSRPPVHADSERRSVLIALAATRPPRGQARPVAAHGRWTVRLRNRGPVAVAVDAWIERDDSVIVGSGRSRSQATFLSEGVPPAPGAPHAATAPVVRRACLNSIAHGAYPVVVAGAVLSTKKTVSYSASGPGRRGACVGPTWVAPCESTLGVGLLAAGTRSGSLVPMNGTSVASAAAARVLYNCAVASGTPIVDPDEDALRASPSYGADRSHPTPDPDLRRGAGMLLPSSCARADGTVARFWAPTSESATDVRE